MKIRNGFVSNSSSSSFVLLGKEITEYDANAMTRDNRAELVLADDDCYFSLGVFGAPDTMEALNDMTSDYYRFYKAYYFSIGDDSLEELKINALGLSGEELLDLVLINGITEN